MHTFFYKKDKLLFICMTVYTTNYYILFCNILFCNTSSHWNRASLYVISKKEGGVLDANFLDIYLNICSKFYLRVVVLVSCV